MYIELFINILDILVTSVFIYFIYSFFKGTYTGTVIKGMLLGVVLYIILRISHLQTITWIFERFFSELPIIFAILFQQEIKRFLSNLGRQYNKTKTTQEFIAHLSKTLEALSETQTGALIILEGNMKLNEFAVNGVILNAEYSKELIETIFHKGTLLHDGAVIIRKERIIAAHVFLPAVFSDQANGTRHAAGVAVSQDHDCIAFIVSEETGSVSYAQSGILHCIDDTNIEEVLCGLLA